MSIFEERDPIFDEDNQARLMREIKTSPDCEIYGVSKYSQSSIKRGIAGSILSAIILILISTAFITGLSTAIALILIVTGTLVICAILSYLNYSHKYFKTYVSSLGIAKDSAWDEGVLPWDKIEYIEIKEKKNEIDYIRFWAGVLKLGYRNSHFVRRLTLDIISEFVGGLENWGIVEDINETTKSDIFYIRPDIDEIKGRKAIERLLLMEWIGEQDFDADQTQIQPSAKPAKELYSQILKDPQCEVILDQGRFSRIITNGKLLVTLLIISFISMFYGMVNGPFSTFAITLTVVLCIIMLMGVIVMVRGDERLVISPIGIARFSLGSPEALEWQYIEFIDFRSEDGQLIPFEFFGNKTRVFCPKHHYKDFLTCDHIIKYLPELNEWNRTRRSLWRKDSFRLVRPTT